ncbi:universal stress protein [Kribbella solani]|uniref:universal stress protein n=1 Tax=Kribbella solani TaxID=236067 RepID=UPI0029A9D4FA|nr:universal stress protein [Kribbella solani]MDX2968431.1 universal stress protein [Kribbella solani]MDX3005045.1 universal stress protein [Kribbella solani]
MRAQIEGSRAVARCRPEVVCAYPISPQTHIVEALSVLAAVIKLGPGKYPAVQVRAAVLAGRAGAEMINLSATASTVVVGSRGRGGVRGLLLGSVSQSLLHHANSPVVIAGRHKES